MLVLSTHADERILIGDTIEVVVVSIRGQRVQLGISAPPSVPVDREEVRRRKGNRATRSQE